MKLNPTRTILVGFAFLSICTFWELYDPQAEDQFSMYGRKCGKRSCHAWGASPLYIIGRFIFGVYPTKAGYEEYEVKPSLGNLKELKGKVPLVDGYIEIEFLEDKITILANTDKKGVLNWKGKKIEIPCKEKITI